MIKSPLGIALAAAAVILAVSPDARKSARKWAVKGTEKMLDVSENIRRIVRDDFSMKREIVQHENEQKHQTIH